MQPRSLLFPALILSFAPLASGAPPVINFDRQVRPILSDNCFMCHGPDEKHRMAGIHFDTKEGAFGKTGVITPGDSAHSKMYLRISNPNDAMRMPPTYSGRKLTATQIEILKNWIDSGAKWETHWAYVPPKRPDLPSVETQNWVRTPIDQFVLARLEKEGLHPSPEADKMTLLRRVTFDLTGLPPTPAELKAFLDDASPGAYEKVVDRLLASPRYGERMTMQWLDFARYSDTHGYHIDSAREMWPWRDWVIQAFNRNMPYDQFTVEQIAGDLLPHPSQPQIIATGFNRNHMINFEGGAIPEEYQNEYIVDRIEATSTTWLGITLGCARCHDHKYDPLRQKDFYSFGAFFNSIAEEGLDGYKGNAKPFLQLPNEHQAATKAFLLKAIKDKDNEIAAAELAWEQHQHDIPVADVTSGLVAEYTFADSLSNRLQPDLAAKVISGKLPFVQGRTDRAADFSGEPQVSLGGSGAFATDQPFTIAMWLKPEGPSGMALLQRYEKSPKTGPGYEITLDYCSKGSCNVIVRFRGVNAYSGIEVKSSEGVALSAWNHLAISYDGSGKAKGVQIYVNGSGVNSATILDRMATLASFERGEMQIGNKEWGTPFKGQLGELRIFHRRLYASEAYELGLLNPMHKVLEIVGERRSEDQRKWLREYFLKEAGNGRRSSCRSIIRRSKKVWNSSTVRFPRP